MGVPFTFADRSVSTAWSEFAAIGALDTLDLTVRDSDLDLELATGAGWQPAGIVNRGFSSIDARRYVGFRIRARSGTATVSATAWTA